MEKRKLIPKLLFGAVLVLYLICAVYGPDLYRSVVPTVRTQPVLASEIHGVRHTETVPNRCILEENGGTYVLAVDTKRNFWYSTSVCTWIPVEILDADENRSAILFLGDMETAVLSDWETLPLDGALIVPQ